jgi:hypothetical protein
MSGTTHKFCFHPYRQVIIGVICAACGIAFLAGAVALASDAGVALTIGSAAASLFFVWAAICRFRMGVRVSGQKLTIVNELRTHIIDASDIRAITLKPTQISKIATHWKPWVELNSGQGVWIYNFDCGPAGRPPRAESAAILEEVRALLGIRGNDLTQVETP